MQNIHTKVTCMVNSSFEHAWAELWRKAHSPRDFIHGIDQLNILQRSDDVIVREMKINNTVIKQKITKDLQNGTVKFHNLADSDIQGDVFNHLLQAEEGKPDQLEMIFYSNATNKKGENFPPKEIFEKALLKTKSVIQATKQI